MTLLAFLVLLPWLCLFWRLRSQFSDWRDAFLAACTCWGVGVVVLTEGLGAMHAISFWPVVGVWVAISTFALGVSGKAALSPVMAAARSLISPLGRGRSQLLLLSGIALIFAATGLTAILSPPNNWDSMTYHLPRVMNWIDYQSVNHYPTHILRQLYSGPWAEFAILHLQILSGGDHFASSVQWVAMLGSVIAVSRIAQKLGADEKGQIFAAVCCATIPMGILQASSTQNDYVAAFWVACFVSLGLELLTEPVSRLNVMLAASALGLAALTKPSTLLFAAPFVLWIVAVSCLRRAISFPMLACAVLAIVLINVPHDVRNLRMFGSVLGPSEEVSWLQNEVHSPAAVASNLIRNVAIHAGGLPRSGSDHPLGRVILAAVEKLHQMIGLATNDRRITFRDANFRVGVMLHEDEAGNPLHLMLGGLAILMCLLSTTAVTSRRLYALSLCMGFLLFCFFLKWQPFHARLHLPWFVLAAPLSATVFTTLWTRKYATATAMVLIIAGLFPATCNALRPLVTSSSIILRDRTSLYFAASPAWEAPYLSAVAELSRTPSARVGIASEIDSWEYPLRILVRTKSSSLEFQHVDVRNASAQVSDPATQAPDWADAIVRMGHVTLDDRFRGYHETYASPPISVLRRPGE